MSIPHRAPGIYAIVHRESGRIYIGSSKNVWYRICQHKSELRSGSHCNPSLLSAWGKYGEGAFDFRLVEAVPDESMLIEREQFWINEMRAANRDTGYNLYPIAGSSRGCKQSPEAVERRASKMRGHAVSPETRAKISVAHKGRKHTEQAIRNMTAASQGRKQTPEAIANRAASMRGKPRMTVRKLSDEQLLEMRVRAASGERQRPLAREFGISQQHASAILRNTKRVSCSPLKTRPNKEGGE